MRSIRQVLHGCKKHRYVRRREVLWSYGACIGEGEPILICINCGHKVAWY